MVEKKRAQPPSSLMGFPPPAQTLAPAPSVHTAPLSGSQSQPGHLQDGPTSGPGPLTWGRPPWEAPRHTQAWEVASCRHPDASAATKPAACARLALIHLPPCPLLTEPDPEGLQLESPCRHGHLHLRPQRFPKPWLPPGSPAGLGVTAPLLLHLACWPLASLTPRGPLCDTAVAVSVHHLFPGFQPPGRGSGVGHTGLGVRTSRTPSSELALSLWPAPQLPLGLCIPEGSFGGAGALRV